LSFISSEFHGTLGALFYGPSEEVANYVRAKLAKKFDYMESTFVGDKQFLVGDKFTIADAYLYICLTWMPYINVDLAPYPKVLAYKDRIGNLPNVKAAHARIAEKPATVL
jgi:glutathione S-transferase